MFHNYEQYNAGVLRNYNGIQELHGARQHGYPDGAGGELDFARWMRTYIRGQVGEVATTRESDNLSTPLAAPDLWNGVFQTVRRGYSPSPWGPPSCNSGAVPSAASFSARTASEPEIVRCPAP